MRYRAKAADSEPSAGRSCLNKSKILKSFRGSDLRLQADSTGGGNARQPLTIVTLLTMSGAGGGTTANKENIPIESADARPRSSPSKFGVQRGSEARPRLEKRATTPSRSLFCSGYGSASG